MVGGDKLEYDDDPTSPAAGLLDSKLLIDSTISDAHKGVLFMSMDLKDYFLASPMKRPEYMKMHLSQFPPDIIAQYNLQLLANADGFVFIKIKKGMYGLKQAAILAYNKLVIALAPHGYQVPSMQILSWPMVS